MSGYFHARDASSVSKRTGIVYIAGEAQPCKASHDKTEPRPPCLLRYDTSLVRSCTQATPFIRCGTGIGAGEAKTPQEIWAKKNRPPCTRHSGRSFREAEAWVGNYAFVGALFRHAPLRIHGNHYQRLLVFAEDPIAVYQTACEGRP